MGKDFYFFRRRTLWQKYLDVYIVQLRLPAGINELPVKHRCIVVSGNHVQKPVLYDKGFFFIGRRLEYLKMRFIISKGFERQFVWNRTKRRGFIEIKVFYPAPPFSNQYL